MGNDVLVYAAEALTPAGVLRDVAHAPPAQSGPGHGTVTEELLAQHIDLRAARRMARVSQLALAAGRRALAAAGLADSPLRDRMPLMFCSGLGAAEHTEEFYAQVLRLQGSYPSPMLFAESVINAPAGHLSIQLGLRGPIRTLSVDWRNGLPALCELLEDLRAGEPLPGLLVAADALTPLCVEVLARCPDGLPQPMPALGEGAVGLVLAREGVLPGPALARITAAAAKTVAQDPGAALNSLPWPLPRGQVLRPAGTMTGTGAFEQRILRGRYPGSRSTSVGRQCGFLFAAQALLEVALAAVAQPRAGAQLIIGSDPLGNAAFVELEPA
jgi:hypothetical protein